MPIKANRAVCWEPTCDGCGDGDNYEWGGSFHYLSETAAREAITDAGWLIEGEKIFCEGCVDTRKEKEQELRPPPGSMIEDRPRRTDTEEGR